MEQQAHHEREFLRTEPMKQACKTFLKAWAMVLLLLLWTGSSVAEGEITGYFEKAKYLRPEMKASGKASATLPAYMAVTVRPVNDKWGEVTLDSGETAFLYYAGILPVPEDTPTEPFPAFCGDSYYVRSLPFSKSPKVEQVESFEEVTVLASSGKFSRVRTVNGTEGYILTERLRRESGAPEVLEKVRFLTEECRSTLRLLEGSIPPALPADGITGTIDRNAVLDSAFAMLEAGNPFVRRYNALTGARITPVFGLGVPYFWGGRDFGQMTERLPDYTTRSVWDGSNAYYKKGTSYLYGLDCTGLVEVAYAQAGMPLKTELSELSLKKHCEAHLWCNDKPMPADWKEVAEGLETGDVLRVRYGGAHVMIYMGTLRDYGYTETDLPALARYLDHPLMIQSGGNPFCYRRFRRLIRASSDERIAHAEPAHGGVSVCIMGVDPRDIPMTITIDEDTYGMFDVEGSCVTAFSMEYVTHYAFLRPGETFGE